jgi:hypothetical protein
MAARPTTDAETMRTNTHFRINEAQAVQEVFDGEVLAINLETGTYYSMPGLSAEVWAWLIRGVPLGTIARTLNEICDDDPRIIAAQIDDFVAKLEEQGLIAPSEAPPAEGQPAVSKPAGKMFVSLILNVYTDMQDLLLLDPIHDVEEAGWPLAKSDIDSAEG